MEPGAAPCPLDRLPGITVSISEKSCTQDMKNTNDTGMSIRHSQLFEPFDRQDPPPWTARTGPATAEDAHTNHNPTHTPVLCALDLVYGE